MAYAICVFPQKLDRILWVFAGKGAFVNFYHKTQVTIHTCSTVLSAGETQSNTDNFRPKLASNLGQVKQVHTSMVYRKM